MVKYFSATKMSKYTKFQKRLIPSAIVAIVVLGFVVIYSLIFLSDNLFRALVPGNVSDTESVQFNLEGFNNLGL